MNTKNSFLNGLMVILVILAVGIGIYSGLRATKPVAVAATTVSSVTSSTTSTPTLLENFAPDPTKPSLITVTSPQTGQTWTAGQPFTVTWSTSNIGDQVLFVALKSTTSNYEQNIGDRDGIENTGSYSGTVDPSTPGGSYQVIVYTSDNLPTGDNSASGLSGVITVNSTTSTPAAPVITSVSASTVYVNNAIHGSGETVVMTGQHLLDTFSEIIGPTGSGDTMPDDLGANTPTGTAESDTQLTFSVPNSVIPGTYILEVKNSEYGFMSQPFQLTVVNKP